MLISIAIYMFNGQHDASTLANNNGEISYAHIQMR